MDSRIQDVQEKLKKERMVLDGATRMLAVQTQASARQMVEVNVVEAQKRIEFLESELRKLYIKRDPTSTAASIPSSLPPSSSHPTGLAMSGSLTQMNLHESTGGHSSVTARTSTSNLDSSRQGVTIIGGSSSHSVDDLPDSGPALNTVETNFDFLRYGAAITAEQVQFRVKKIQSKLDIEQKVRTGTENMLAALGSTINDDPKRKARLDQRLAEAKVKEMLLFKAKTKLDQIYLKDNEHEDDSHIYESSKRKTGKLSVKVIGAANITGRKSQREEIIAQVLVDSVLKYTTRPSRQKWEESMDLTVDKALEVEINILEKSGALLAMCWFKIADLDENLEKRFGINRPSSMDTVPETWLEMEPSGQLHIKLSFASVQRSKTEKDRIFRRNPVQKIYPRNGHRFFAMQFYQVMQCAFCNEFLGRQGYQCQTCRYTVHPKCHHRVITKCISSEEINTVEDKNTGQLLKYKIPHRWDNVTNLLAAWCVHCGYLIPPGRKIHRCSECSRSSHKECSMMVPYFCGLAPDMADTLMAAFDEHEKKMIQKELEEAEKSRTIMPIFDSVTSTDSAEFSAERIGGEDVSHTVSDGVAIPVPAMGTSNLESINKIPGPTPPPIKESSPSFRKSIDRSPRPSGTDFHVSARTSSLKIKMPPKDVTLEDFHFVAVLGRGAFGKVMLATEKTTNQVYAIKALKKEFIIQNDDVKSTKLEKFIFQAASAEHHPFMVNLHSSFQTESRIYFVMEYVAGGDLMCHIQDKKRFSQARTRFYACEVLLALQYFHLNNIVYRDLKLDNILLGIDGHIKVADYGICKANMPYGATTSTFCGTPDYMAPEILMNRRYGVAVDWWSFGVLIFVMLVGRYPFHGEDENDILEAILSDSIEYPSNMPRITLSLLQSLMNKVPSRRLGGGSADAEEVKKHPYFVNVDWAALMRKEMTAPFVPTIAGTFDVSNFDKEFTSEQPVLTPISSVLGEMDQKEFNDFQYISDWAYQARCAASIQCK
ncbi:Serine/threonine kinase [Batrachochytrium dendrobatidis]|nr:Serine/threonine kinase [Batrachochytrium dendrobatidis]KAK5671771.1 Serine/threonine kinase [Batrachochytrium dendrobatidis]